MLYVFIGEHVNECPISDKTYRLVVAEKSFNMTLRVNPPFCISRGYYEAANHKCNLFYTQYKYYISDFFLNHASTDINNFAV